MMRLTNPVILDESPIALRAVASTRPGDTMASTARLAQAAMASAAHAETVRSEAARAEVALAENRLADASRLLTSQLDALEAERVPAEVVKVLEELGWAKLRMAEETHDIAALEIVASPRLAPRSLSDMTGPEMLMHAHRLRSLQLHQRYDVRMAKCCIRLAEYYWVIDDYPAIIRAYNEALIAYEANGLEFTQDAVRLLSWLGHAHAQQLEYSAAMRCFDRALAAVPLAFGTPSWELFRQLLDKACVLGILGDTLASIAGTSAEARWAAAESQQVVHRLRSLHRVLSRERTEDASPSSFAVFAPMRRQVLTMS